MSRYFITTAIPYVNAPPHIGFALELIQTDVLARHRRQRGDEVRFQTGTDDNALKNVQSARKAGLPTPEYVNQMTERFAQLREPLDLSFDDFIKTSSDPRHLAGVEKFWRTCAASGDFYQKEYEGLYCVGCEQFYTPDELVDGKCPEHDMVPERVQERNWFFRLSKYQDQLAQLIRSGELDIQPEHRKNEVLSFVEGGLVDFSISRSFERAHGWGIPVPDDPSQVIYVWWDALANYITAPGYGNNPELYRKWWEESSSRVHVIGKGILRFHAVYWPAMLLSAGERLPTTIFIHEYLTVEGKKMSKSLGNVEDPVYLAEHFGTTPLRWWVLREVTRVGDSDFSRERLVARANEDLANNLGNLINRTISMINRYRSGQATPALSDQNERAAALNELRQRTSSIIDSALAQFDFRSAVEAILQLADEGNRYVMATQPWKLAAAEADGADRRELDVVLSQLLGTCRELGQHLQPFLPQAAAAILAQCGPEGGVVGEASPIFRRLELVSEPVATN